MSYTLSLFILMDYLIHKISMEVSILYSKESQVEIFLKIVFILENSIDHDEMWYFICFYTVCHCTCTTLPGLEVIKLKIKRNDWLLVDMCPQAANHCVLF